MEDKISRELLGKYFGVTQEALERAKGKFNGKRGSKRYKDGERVYDMAFRYFSDAKYFYSRGKWVLAYGALNYAHGWLDVGAYLGLFKVKGESRLFTTD